MHRHAIVVVSVFLGASAPTTAEEFKFRTDAGRYNLQLTPHDSQPTLGTLHHWHLLLTDPQGKPVDGATVRVDGGMPAHGHGLPTAPKVVSAERAGTYRIEGLRFNMPGDWELRLAIEGIAGSDTARLEFRL